MFNLWTTLKWSVRGEKNIFFSRNFTLDYSQAKKMFEWWGIEIFVSKAPDWSIPACPTALEASHLVAISFFPSQNYVCFLFESGRTGTSNRSGWKLNEAKRGVASRSSFISCSFPSSCWFKIEQAFGSCLIACSAITASIHLLHQN